jgi:plasmid stabilization system protein ParE
VKGRASYHRLAEQELIEAARWYERESPRLAAAFALEIERCVAAILYQPMAGRSIDTEVRRRLVRRFPYAILYRITGEGIRILAVMNLHRHPSCWVGRH